MNWYWRKKKILWALLLWLGLQLGYVGVTAVRYMQWDAEVPRDADGVALFAQEQILGQGERVVLFVHGFGDTPHVWENLLSELEHRGLRLRTLRLEGWGASLAAKRRVRVSDWQDQIRRVVQEERHAGRKVFLLAHSMGGCLSVNLVMDGALGDVEGLRLYAPMLGISDTRSPMLTPRQWHEVAKWIAPMVRSLESVFPDHTRRVEPRSRHMRDPFVSRNIYDLLFEEIKRAHRKHPELNLRLHLVLPGVDWVVDTEVALAWFQKVKAAEKSWSVCEEAGHTLPLDCNPAREAEAILSWMNQSSCTSE